MRRIQSQILRLLAKQVDIKKNCANMPPKRKQPLTKKAAAEAVVVDTVNGDEPPVAKKPRGRPPKQKETVTENEKPVKEILEKVAEETEKDDKKKRTRQAKQIVEEVEEKVEGDDKKKKSRAVKQKVDNVAEKDEHKKKPSRAVKQNVEEVEETNEDKKKTSRSAKQKVEKVEEKVAKKEEDKKTKSRSAKQKVEKDEAKVAEKDEDKKKRSAPEKKTATNTVTTDYDETDFTNDRKSSSGGEANLKLVSWNVGGLRAWLKKDGLTYLEQEDADVVCFQEIKCATEKLPEEIKNISNYKTYWLESKKDGYAGVALLSKVMPIDVTYGIGVKEQDEDGRCITAEFKYYYLINVYVPNAGRGLVTLPKRLKWNEAFKKHVMELDKRKPVVICGDMNVAHNEIDLANPKSNKKNAGFTQEERDGMTDFLGSGFVDTFRELYPKEEKAYTFWSYMGNARKKNVGWRLDYFLVSERLQPKVCDSVIRKSVFGSDHCPVVLYFHAP